MWYKRTERNFLWIISEMWPLPCFHSILIPQWSRHFLKRILVTFPLLIGVLDLSHDDCRSGARELAEKDTAGVIITISVTSYGSRTVCLSAVECHGRGLSIWPWPWLHQQRFLLLPSAPSPCYVQVRRTGGSKPSPSLWRGAHIFDSFCILSTCFSSFFF